MLSLLEDGTLDCKLFLSTSHHLKKNTQGEGHDGHIG